MLTINPGHSVTYLTREVATGRENYYTGAVIEGEPPGRWYGAGAEALGLTGSGGSPGHGGAVRALRRPARPGVQGPGPVGRRRPRLDTRGRTYKTAEQLYEQYLDAEPYADPERREQLRLQASKNEQHNVAFYDVTFSVPKSITVLHAAFEAPGGEGPPGRRHRGGRGVGGAQAGGRGRDLGRQQRRAGLPGRDRPATPGSGTTAAARAGSSTRTTGPSPRSSSTPAATNDPQLHIHDAILSRVQGADGHGAPWTARALYLHKPAAGAVADRTMFEHAGPQLARAGGDAPGRQVAARSSASTRRSTTCSPAGGRTISPEGRRTRARLRAARTAASPPRWNCDRLHRQATSDHPPAQVPRRRNPRTAAGPVGGRSYSAELQSAWTRSPATCSALADQEPGGADVRPGRGDRDRARRRAGQARRRGREPTWRGRSTTRCRTTSAAWTAPTWPS